MKKVQFKHLGLLMLILLFAGLVTPVLAHNIQESGVYGPMGCMAAEEGCIEYGQAQLMRHQDRVSLRLQSSGLEAGAVYTVWFVVFNNPEYCDGPCGADDLGDPDVVTSLLWGSGRIVGNQGQGRFSAVLREGNPPGEVISGPGLLDASKAEIHAVLRTHGAPIPGLVREQLTTLAGGCEVNTCANQQFAIFP